MVRFEYQYIEGCKVSTTAVRKKFGGPLNHALGEGGGGGGGGHLDFECVCSTVNACVCVIFLIFLLFFDARDSVRVHILSHKHDDMSHGHINFFYLFLFLFFYARDSVHVHILSRRHHNL
jgi:hypothetical protein